MNYLGFYKRNHEFYKELSYMKNLSFISEIE